MRKSKLIVLTMFMLLMIFPTLKQAAFNYNSTQDDYSEYYDSMMVKGSWSEEEFAVFGEKAREFEKLEDSRVGKEVTYVLLLTSTYYLLFLWFIYLLARRREWFSCLIALLMVVVLFSIST